jgi:hypothetical protein
LRISKSFAVVHISHHGENNEKDVTLRPRSRIGHHDFCNSAAKKHMMPGKTDAECVQACVKDGSSYVLVSGAKVYKLAAKPQTIAPFAGKHVHIVGSVNDNSITVASISEMPHNMKM